MTLRRRRKSRLSHPRLARFASQLTWRLYLLGLVVVVLGGLNLERALIPYHWTNFTVHFVH